MVFEYKFSLLIIGCIVIMWLLTRSTSHREKVDASEAPPEEKEDALKNALEQLSQIEA